MSSHDLALVPGTTYAFGTPAPRSGDFLFSNDGPIPEEAFAPVRSSGNGLSLHIGSGALVSLMPDHSLQPVMVDCNPVVITMNQITTGAILQSATVSEAYEHITTEGTKLVKKLPKPRESSQNIADNLAADASQYRLGERHWSRRFHAVQEALRERPPIHVVSDVRNPSFVTAMQKTSEQFGSVKLFNATNVHLPLYSDPMRFLRELPFAEDATVLASINGAYVDFMRGRSHFYSLERFVMQGIENYIDFVTFVRSNSGTSAQELRRKMQRAKDLNHTAAS